MKRLGCFGAHEQDHCHKGLLSNNQAKRTSKHCLEKLRALKAALPVLQASRNVTDQPKLEELLAEAREAADFIKTAVVQAKLNDRGNYGALHPAVGIWSAAGQGSGGAASQAASFMFKLRDKALANFLWQGCGRCPVERHTKRGCGKRSCLKDTLLPRVLPLLGVAQHQLPRPQVAGLVATCPRTHC
jgi:hypothetical protein